MADPFTFDPIYQSRVWGGRMISEVLHRAVKIAGPVGESWELVDRPEAQSVVNSGPAAGQTMHQLWREKRTEVFGANLAGERFPLLVKIVDAATPLSVQVHPPLEVAQTLAGEPKTEVWYFVETTPDSAVYVGLKKGVGRKDFEEAIRTGTVANLVHRIETESDEFIFIPSGRIHAIDAGNLIYEIQQNSDTTYRVFDWNRLGLDGKPRQLHESESLASIDFEDHTPSLGQPDGETIVSCDHFHVERWQLNVPRPAHDQPEFAVFQVIQGQVSCGSRHFVRGDLFLVPASEHRLAVEPKSADARLLRTTL